MAHRSGCSCEQDAKRAAADFSARTGIPVWWKDYYDAEQCSPNPDSHEWLGADR